MKKKLLVLGTSAILALNAFPALAVEDGVDASGSQFVVPIKMELSPGKASSCSGALIAPYIVVTAGHCVIDSSGLVATKIYVGLAGSSLQSITTDDIIDAVKITSSYQSGGNSKVNDDDLAFLTLRKPQTMPVPVVLASESEMLTLKKTNGQLKLIGYGKYGDSSEEIITFPKSFVGTFSQADTVYTNSAYLESTGANACLGDSGSPILSITASQVTIIGIVTGFANSKYCTKVQPVNGKRYALFTLIGRYSNLAFAAANQSMSTLSNKNEKVQSDLDGVRAQLEDYIFDLAEANRRLETLEASIESNRKSAATLSTKLKKICSVKPKPKGC